MANAAISTLPAMITSPGDIKRLRREVESVEDFLHQASLRQGGTAVKMPATSRFLDEIVSVHGLNLLKQTDRNRLVKYLTILLDEAPVLHISFASDPSPAFMTKLMTWLRANIHPQLLVRVGLQPSIAAGCIIRTSSHEYDMSLKHALEGRKSVLVEVLKAEAAS